MCSRRASQAPHSSISMPAQAQWALKRSAVAPRMSAFVERAPAALKVLRGNLERLGIDSGFRVHAGAWGRFSGQRSKASPKPGGMKWCFSILPTTRRRSTRLHSGCLAEQLAELLAPDALVIAEHRRKQPLERAVRVVSQRTRLLEQGDAALSFYAVESRQSESDDPEKKSEKIRTISGLRP